MKKILSLALMLVFLFSAVPVYADGIGNNELGNYPGVIDYRDAIISVEPIVHPSAGFSVQIKSEGNLLPNTVESAAIGDPRYEIVPEQDSPAIKAQAGDKIIINNLSNPGSGSSLIYYDIQYRFTPQGEDRHKHEIKSAIVRDFGKVKNIIENLNLEEEGTYEIFLCVADNAPCIGDAINWSTNGNVRSISYNNKNFAKGVFWYFTEAVVEVGGESPDFYPTPEGSSEYKEEYKTCAKTYEGKKGEPITFPVTLHNVGAKAITDFRAVWERDGQDPITGWLGTNPPWQSEPIELAKGESKTFDVTVTVPDLPRRLFFKANVDGLTPAKEINQDNNQMAIFIMPDGVDVSIFMPYEIHRTVKPGEKALVTVGGLVRKHDYTQFAEVKTTFIYPGGTKVEHTTLYRTMEGEKQSQDYDYDIYLSPGTYKVTGQVEVLNAVDIKPANNYGETIITIYQEKDYSAEKVNPDRETRVNLRD
jgi:hypothetical protein